MRRLVRSVYGRVCFTGQRVYPDALSLKTLISMQCVLSAGLVIARLAHVLASNQSPMRCHFAAPEVLLPLSTLMVFLRYLRCYEYP